MVVSVNARWRASRRRHRRAVWTGLKVIDKSLHTYLLTSLRSCLYAARSTALLLVLYFLLRVYVHWALSSSCPSVCLWRFIALWHHLVPQKALPIHFSADTFTVRCRPIIQPQYTVKKRTAEISASGIAKGSVVTWPWLFQTRHFRRFGSADITSYALRSSFLMWDTLLV